ncbi:MAG: beta-ketoacyl-[acyl-carrier-protein] synthase family protein [Desulfonatronovibrio sp.]
MSKVFVRDMRIVTALGDLQNTYAALLAAKSGISPVSPGFPGLAATISALDFFKKDSRMIPLLDMLLSSLPEVPADTLLITATTKAGIDNLESCMRRKGTNIYKTMPQWLACHVRHRLGLTQPGFAVSSACASSTIALAQGAKAIASGRAQSVLVVCADIVSEFVLRGFDALKALDSQPCRPFDQNRAGLSLGEGAAAIHLVSANTEDRAAVPMLGEILGWGVACNAVHITAPARDGRGLIRAVNRALDRAGLCSRDVGAVNAHGTGTVYNDAMEITAVKAVFKGRPLPVYSVKGAVGHTMAASGAVETALGLKSLHSGLIPPTVGLKQPDKEAWRYVSSEMQELSQKVMVTTNSGFGGINAALVLSMEECTQ